MLSILADMMLNATRHQREKEFPDHLRETADRYVRSPRAERHYRKTHPHSRNSDLW